MIKNTSVLLLIDLQEKLMSVIRNRELVIENITKLIQSFKLLNVSIIYTEQYPKGLGPTISEIQSYLNGIASEEKTQFSCFGCETLTQELNKLGQVDIIIAGIETHICVQQTVLDLLRNNFKVILVGDATSSRKQIDYDFALERMKTAGADITSTESIIFELLKDSKRPEFKEISQILK